MFRSLYRQGVCRAKLWARMGSPFPSVKTRNLVSYGLTTAEPPDSAQLFLSEHKDLPPGDDVPTWDAGGQPGDV